MIACSKSGSSDSTGGGGSVNPPVTRLMGFNLSPDKSAIGFSMSGSYLTSAPLSYGSYTGNYIDLYPGDRVIDMFDYANSASPISSLKATLDTNKFYSIFFIGAGSNHKGIFVRDVVDTLSGDAADAYVRYINAITDSTIASNVIIENGGVSFVNDSAGFGTVSDFKLTTPGQITVTVKNSNGVDISKTIPVDQKRAYTILLMGTPGSATTPAEIKYIINARVKDPAQ